MKHILLLLSFVCSAALAQTVSNPCGVPIPPGVVKNYADVLPLAGTTTTTPGTAYTCAPAPAGAGTLPTVRSNSSGVMAWWYCKVGPKWYPSWGAVTAKQLSIANLAADAYSVMTAPDPVAAVNAMAAKNITLPLSDPSLTPVWCPFQQEMWDGTPAPDAPPPVPPTFIVAPNGTNTTRPAFLVTNGIRAFGSFNTANVGAACECSVQIVEGQITFCRVNPATEPMTLVASCVKAP